VFDVPRTFAWAQTSQAPYYKGVPLVRTTISCRLFAQLLTLAAGCLALSAVASTARAAERAPKLPTAVTWSVPLAAPASASPVFGGDLIFVPLQSGIVAAHRIADGAEVWRRELRTTAPLAFDGGRLFVAAADAIYALNEDGSAAWHAETGALTAPLLARDGWVVAVAAGQVTALRAADGSVVWRRPVGAARERPSVEGTSLFVSLEDGRVLALDLATGAPKWERRLKGAPTEVLPFADYVYVGAADKVFYCLDAQRGEIQWRQQVGAVLRGQPAADDSRVFVVALDNLLRAFDRGNGALRWSPRGVPFRPTAGPVVAGHLVMVAGTANEIRGFETLGGQPAGLLTLPEALSAVPAFSRSGETLRIAAVTGSLTQQWKLLLAISDPPGPEPLVVEPLSVLPGLPVPIPRPPG
jgi:outer membrane protein assembly factor BamB